MPGPGKGGYTAAPWSRKNCSMCRYGRMEFWAPLVITETEPQALAKVMAFANGQPCITPKANPPIKESPAAVVSTGVTGKAGR